VLAKTKRGALPVASLPDARLEQRERAEHVLRGVEHRIGDALAHVDLRGEVQHDVEAAVAHQGRRLGLVMLASTNARRPAGSRAGRSPGCRRS
jgi:hypothetical protein